MIERTIYRSLSMPFMHFDSELVQNTGLVVASSLILFTELDVLPDFPLVLLASCRHWTPPFLVLSLAWDPPWAVLGTPPASWPSEEEARAPSLSVVSFSCLALMLVMGQERDLYS